MKSVAYAVAALALIAAPVAQAAENICAVNLRGVDLTTDVGQSKAKIAIEAAAEEFCGRTDYPQPLAMRAATEKCLVAVKTQAERQVKARTQQALAKSTVLASR